MTVGVTHTPHTQQNQKSGHKFEDRSPIIIPSPRIFSKLSKLLAVFSWSRWGKGC